MESNGVRIYIVDYNASLGRLNSHTFIRETKKKKVKMKKILLKWEPIAIDLQPTPKCQAVPKCKNSAAQVINGQSVCIACATTGLLALLGGKK